MMKGFYKGLLDALHEGVYFVDRDRRITYWNKGAQRITGYESAEVLGRACADNILCHVDETGRQLCRDGCPLTDVMADGEARECEIFLRHREGHRVPVAVRATPIRNGKEIIGAVEIFSSNLKAAQFAELVQRLQNEALRDPLTKLGNRRFAEMNLDNYVRAFDRHKSPFGVLFLDLDHFKNVNDKHGHNAGDAVLKMVATTIVNGIRPLDIPCRWGGEEFVIILPDTGRDALTVVADRLRALIASSWLTHEERKLRITTSIGGAVARQGESWLSLVGRADRQVYLSKQAGRNCLHFDDSPE